MSVTLFEHLNTIFNNQNPKYFDELSDEDKKTFSVWMINRFVSMNSSYLPVVNEIQQYWEYVSPREVYLFYSQILPRAKQYNKYVKSSKEQDKYEEWLIDLLKKHWQLSKMEVIDALHILYLTKDGKNHIRQICEGFGIESKLIKKAGI